MYETVKGPDLRKWCQTVGLLDEGEDFADKRQRGNQLTVRAARTFILNYFLGKKASSQDFDQIKTTACLAKTGVVDQDWEALRNNNPTIWTDAGLKEAGKAFAALIKAQSEYFLKKKGEKGSSEYAEKPLLMLFYQPGPMLLGFFRIILSDLKDIMACPNKTTKTH